MANVPHCTCSDLSCSCHPVNQPNGCTPCIASNLKRKELPACFWDIVDPEHKRERYHFPAFAQAVFEAMVANPESATFFEASLGEAGPKLDFRFAGISDVWDIAKLEETCFPPEEAASATQMMQRIMYFGDSCWLGFYQDKLVTFCLGMVTDRADLTDDMFANPALHDADGAWQMIFSVATDPDFQGRGFAGMVIEQCINDTRERGKRGLVLTCKEPLVDYYAKFGFVDEGLSVSEHGGAQWHQMRLAFS